MAVVFTALVAPYSVSSLWLKPGSLTLEELTARMDYDNGSRVAKHALSPVAENGYVTKLNFVNDHTALVPQSTVDMSQLQEFFCWLRPYIQSPRSWFDVTFAHVTVKKNDIKQARERVKKIGFPNIEGRYRMSFSRKNVLTPPGA